MLHAFKVEGIEAAKPSILAQRIGRGRRAQRTLAESLLLPCYFVRRDLDHLSIAKADVVNPVSTLMVVGAVIVSGQ